MIEHDENRERELQILCKSIIETELPRDREYDIYCPFCSCKTYDDNKRTIQEINHYLDCVYFIVKDLYVKESAHE